MFQLATDGHSRAKWDGYRTLVFDDNGRPNLALVQRSDAGSDREAVLRIFDMLSINGTDMVEALLVCQLNEDGELVFAGRIATNFDLATLVFLRRQLDLLTVDECRFSELPSAKHRRGARWVFAQTQGNDRNRRVHQRRRYSPRELHQAGKLTLMASPDLPSTNHVIKRALADSPLDRSVAKQFDAADALAEWRDRFVLRDPALIYLDGNSLGMTPVATVDAMRRVIEEQWAGDLITSWWENDWLDLPLTVGNELAPLLGAAEGTVAVHDSTTVGIFQLLNVALDLPATGAQPRPPVIAFAPNEFPTDRYAAEGVARLRNGAVRSGLADLDGVGVVIRSMVDYRSAEICDVAAETKRANDAGAITVWDLSHAVGVLDLNLPALGVDLAVGCTYKFLNGGPGAPGFTYVAPHLHDDVTQPIWGWFGQTDQFAMDNAFDPKARQSDGCFTGHPASSGSLLHGVASPRPPRQASAQSQRRRK